MKNVIPVEFCPFRRQFIVEEIIKHRHTVESASQWYGLEKSVIMAMVKQYLKRRR